MAGDTLTLALRTIGDVYAFILILRFLLQVAGADYYNPISQTVVRFTQAPLAPLQRLIPRVARLDITPLILAFILKFAVVAGIIFLSQSALPNLVGIALYALFGVLDSILTIYFWAVIGSVILSWIAPNSYHPGPQLIIQLTDPLFALARKVIPSIGGLDLSPILIFFVIQILQSAITSLVM